MQVSAHLLIRRGGEVIQFVPLHLRAWHAGQSGCEGRTRVNDFSIGIELEGTEDQPFESAQYQTLAELTRAIRQIYPAVAPERVYGHADIAPGRKADPGPFFRLAALSYAVYVAAAGTRGAGRLPSEVQFPRREVSVHRCRKRVRHGHWALLATSVPASVQYPCNHE